MCSDSLCIVAMWRALGALSRAAASAAPSRAVRPWPRCAPAACVQLGAPARSLFNFGAKDGPLDVEAEAREIHSSLLTPLNSKLLGPLGTPTWHPQCGYPLLILLFFVGVHAAVVGG